MHGRTRRQHAEMHTGRNSAFMERSCILHMHLSFSRSQESYLYRGFLVFLEHVAVPGCLKFLEMQVESTDFRLRPVFPGAAF